MFSSIARAYDLLHPPAERLARIGPALSAWCGPADQVLELACGTGAVAVHLAEALPTRQVTACDLSPSMLAQARLHPRVAYQLGDMRRPPAGPYARALILGNSLNLLPDQAAVGECLKALQAVLAPAGRLLIQLANPDAAAWREPRLIQKQAEGLVATKSLVPWQGRHLLTLSWAAADGCGAEAQVLLDLRPADLEPLLAAAGFSGWSFLGDLGGTPYEAGASPDLVVEAW